MKKLLPVALMTVPLTDAFMPVAQFTNMLSDALTEAPLVDAIMQFVPFSNADLVTLAAEAEPVTDTPLPMPAKVLR